jgi:dihydrofolate reductase
MIEGPKGELDWIADWGDEFGLTSEIDACLLGGGMYGGYERYWTSILADPAGTLEFTDRKPTAGEIDYAAWADRMPHYVLSTTLRQTNWKVATILHHVRQVRELKQRPGRAIHAVGGAGLVASLMNCGLVDELRVIVNPIILGQGKRLFGDVTGIHRLTLLDSVQPVAGRVKLVYEVSRG